MRALVMPLITLFVVVLASCGPGELSDFCTQALEDNEACLSNSSAEECEARNEECPGEVAIAESCPVQFFCPAP